MFAILRILLFALLALALWRKRWAYVAFVILSLLMIPLRTGFRLVWPSCDLTPTAEQLAQSLGNAPHIVLFAAFFILTAIQFRGPTAARFAKSALVAFVVGIIVELEQGATRTGNCDLEDLVPNAIGILIGMGVMTLWQRVVRRP